MTTPPVPAMPQQSRLLGQLRNTIRLKHYRIRTEPAYVDRIGRFVLPDDKRHPSDMGAAEIEGYLGVTPLWWTGNRFRDWAVI